MFILEVITLPSSKQRQQEAKVNQNERQEEKGSAIDSTVAMESLNNLLKEGFSSTSKEFTKMLASYNKTQDDPDIISLIAKRTSNIKRLKDLLSQNGGNTHSYTVQKVMDELSSSHEVHPPDVKAAINSYRRGGPSSRGDLFTPVTLVQGAAVATNYGTKLYYGAETLQAVETARKAKQVADVAKGAVTASRFCKGTAALAAVGAVIEIGVDAFEAANARPEEQAEAWTKTVVNAVCIIGCGAAGHFAAGAIGQALCPIPGVGFALGLVVGSLIGNYIAKPAIHACMSTSSTTWGSMFTGFFGR